MSYSGAKIALFLGDNLLVILRDDRPDIPFPAHWDFPGGGREGDETPQDCALRETYEEVGLVLSADQLVWSNTHQQPHGTVWFFVAHLPAEHAAKVAFGGEGQEWRLMAPLDYCAHPRAVPHFSAQLRTYLEERKLVPLHGKTPRLSGGGR